MRCLNLLFTNRDYQRRYYERKHPKISLFKAKKNKIYEYQVAFGNISKVLINPIERMIAEKTSIAIYGIDNTRDKDLFDLFFLLKEYEINKKVMIEILEVLLIRRFHYFSCIDLAIKSIIKTLDNTSYVKSLNNSNKNWINEDPVNVVKCIKDFLQKL